MDRRLFDPGEARDQLESWRGRIDQLAADTKAMSDQLEQLRLTVSDPNRMVEVTVDSTGNLLDLHLSQQIKKVSNEVVSRTIMETLQEAKRQLAERSTEIIQSTIGSESEAARAIASKVRQQLTPEPEEEGR